MKKLTIMMVAVLTFGATQAGFTVKVPLESPHGGPLSSGSLIFVTTPQSPQNPAFPSENWQPYTPEYSEWVNSGEVTACSWEPATSTVVSGQPFTQTATDCQQLQTRNKQEREMDSVTLTIRNVGDPVTEIQSITVSSTRSAIGKAPDCRYEVLAMGGSGFYMLNGADPSVGDVYWNSTSPIGKASFGSLYLNGYRYYAGILQSGWSYQVCREFL